MSQALPGAGWYRDHWRIDALRWWDGVQWTGWVAPWCRQMGQPDIEHPMTSASQAWLDVARADEQQSPSPEPFDVPSVLVGKTSRLVAPVGLFLLAAFFFVATLTTFFGNHLPVGWKLITGVSIQSALFLGLVAWGVFALRHPLRLELASDGVVIHGWFRGRRTEVSWQDITAVVLRANSVEGVPWVWPAVERRTGKTIVIPALVEFPWKGQRASEAVDRLLATRDAQLRAPSNSRSPSRTTGPIENGAA